MYAIKILDVKQKTAPEPISRTVFSQKPRAFT
jgi:hypothetical protein